MNGITLIAAMDINRAIGFDNQMPWHLPDDLKHFKNLTSGKTIVMGRKTAQSLGRALPNRLNIVLSRSPQSPIDGMHVVSQWAEIVERAQHEEIMLIGGGEIYTLALPFASKMHLTYVDTELLNADAYFPAFDPNQWQALNCVNHDKDSTHEFDFSFIDYQRI